MKTGTYVVSDLRYSTNFIKIWPALTFYAYSNAN